MTHATRLALLIATLLLVIITSVAAGWGLTLWETSIQSHQWCDTLTLLTKNPVPKPADPQANPSRQQSYLLYSDFVKLRHKFGCQ